jgi:hypothetical protein
LADGQVLIVSVVASPNPDSTLQDIAEDFAICARWAVEAGAHVIEANLSCPNVCSVEGSLYHDAVASRMIALRIRDSIHNVPLLLKVSTFPSQDAQREFMMSVRTVSPWSIVFLGQCSIATVVLYLGLNIDMLGFLVERSINHPWIWFVRPERLSSKTIYRWKSRRWVG